MASFRQMSVYLFSVLLVIGAYANGREVDLRPPPIGRLPTCDKEYSCASCNAARICSQRDGAWREKIVVACSPTSPYCDYVTGTCSSQPTLECSSKDKFNCVKDGTFPDPSDCRRYHVCSNLTSSLHKCHGHHFRYDSGKEKCVHGAKCYTFDCLGKNGVKVAFGRDASIFAYCVHGSSYTVDRCPGNYELSSSKQICLPKHKCDSDRLLPDKDDCTKYYKRATTPFGYRPTLTHEACPSGEGFDPTCCQCVNISLLPDCKKTT